MGRKEKRAEALFRAKLAQVGVERPFTWANGSKVRGRFKFDEYNFMGKVFKILYKEVIYWIPQSIAHYDVNDPDVFNIEWRYFGVKAGGESPEKTKHLSLDNNSFFEKAEKIRIDEENKRKFAPDGITCRVYYKRQRRKQELEYLSRFPSRAEWVSRSME